MIIEKLTVTPFQQNCRLVYDQVSKRGSVIDPGGDVSQISSRIEQLQLEIESVLLTHAHIDHCGGAQDLLEILAQSQSRKVTLAAHPLEKDFRSSIEKQALMFGLPTSEYKNCPEPDVYLDQGSIVSIANTDFEIRFTPGHSPGHIAFVCSNEVTYQLDENGNLRQNTSPLAFSGDALFAGSIGRTDLPGGDYDILIYSIKSQLLTLADNTLIMSGHGPDTTILKERTTNPFLLAGG